MSDQNTPPALVAEITRAARITDAAVTSFSKASIAPSSVLTGLVTGFAGLAGCHIFGIDHPAYASALLDACAFVSSGSLGLLVSRLFGSAKQRISDERRRVDYSYNTQTLAIQTETLIALAETLSPEARDAFAKKALLTFDALRTAHSPEAGRSDEEFAAHQLKLPRPNRAPTLPHEPSTDA